MTVGGGVSVARYLFPSNAVSTDGTLAMRVKVNKNIWESKEALYSQLLPSFDKVYTPLWKPFTDTKILVDQCAACLSPD